MARVFLGLVKGGLIGAAVGAAAVKLGIAGGLLGLLTYALVGALVGVLCGRPPWRQDTVWTTALKAIFGAVVAGALTFGARKLLGGAHLGFVGALASHLGGPAAADRPLVDLPVALGPLIGALWGAFVEVDDGGGAEASAKGAAKPSRR